MKGIQSLVYALTGVNIFANAGAKAYSNMANNIKKAKNESKQLAGVHNEINNIQSPDSSDSGNGSGTIAPSFDLSGVENVSSSILDAIKNNDWYQVGFEIGKKINEALEKIDWDKIQKTTKNIATNIGNFINGFVDGTDWSLLGSTIGNGINTALIFVDTLLTTTNFENIGKAIATFLNSGIQTIDWGVLGETLGDGIKGTFDTIKGFLETFDWGIIIQSIVDFITNVDYSGISDALFKMLGSAVASLMNLGMNIGEFLNTSIVDPIANFFLEEIEKCGGNIAEGLLNGIIKALENIGQWVIDHIFTPFIDGVKNVFGIHSPSTVMVEIGEYLIEGLLKGLLSLKENVIKAWEKVKGWFSDIVKNAKVSIKQKWSDIKEKWGKLTEKIKDKTADMKAKIATKWSDIKQKWKNLTGNIKTKTADMKARVASKWGDLKKKWNDLMGNFKDKTIGVKVKLGAIIDNVKNWLNEKFIDKINSKVPDWFPHIPRLAKGGVLYNETAFIGGEYSGARSNPEIVTPQNIMYDTMKRALSEIDLSNSNGQVRVQVYLGTQNIVDEVIDEINRKTRRTGKAQIKVSYA